MTDAITVRAVKSWRDRQRFQRLPWTIYAGDPNWVPPILSQERLLLGWGRHPFFDHAEMVTFLAERNGRIAGRIAVFVNDIHNAKYDEKRGFLAFSNASITSRSRASCSRRAVPGSCNAA